jgi:large subunit ribosomal protein L24
MSQFHVKKGDEVVVIAGREKGRRGTILRVSGKKGRAVVEGLHMIQRHTKKNQQNPQGAIVKREGTVHISNLMKAEKFDARAAARAGGAAGAAAETPTPGQDPATPSQT